MNDKDLKRVIKLSEEIGRSKQICSICDLKSRKCWKKCGIGKEWAQKEEERGTLIKWSKL